MRKHKMKSATTHFLLLSIKHMARRKTEGNYAMAVMLGKEAIASGTFSAPQPLCHSSILHVGTLLEDQFGRQDLEGRGEVHHSYLHATLCIHRHLATQGVRGL